MFSVFCDSRLKKIGLVYFDVLGVDYRHLEFYLKVWLNVLV